MVVVVALALLGAAAFFAALFSRSRPDPMVEHQRAIDTLREIAEHPQALPDLATHAREAPGDHVHVLSDSPPLQVSHAQLGTWAGRSDRRGSRVRSVDYSSRPTVASLPTIGPARRADAPAVPVPAAEPQPPAPPGAHRLSNAIPASPSRRSLPRLVGAAAVVVAIATTIAATRGGSGSARHAPPRPKTHATTTTTTARATTASTPVTSAAVAQVVATAGGNATVTVSFPLAVTLHATGTCWVLAHDQSGRTLWTGVLHAGQQQAIPATGPFVVRLGYTPAVTVSAGNASVPLTGLGNTADLTFAPA